MSSWVFFFLAYEDHQFLPCDFLLCCGSFNRGYTPRENLLLLPQQPTSLAAPQLEVDWCHHAQLSLSSLSMLGCGLTRACTDLAFVVTTTLRSNVQLLCHAQKALFLCSHQPSRRYILSSPSLQWFLNPEEKGSSNCVLHRDKHPTVLQSAILYTLTGSGSLC